MYQFAIDEKYSHNSFVKFLLDFLPDSFAPENDAIYWDSKLLNVDGESCKLGTVESLNLSVYEFQHSLETDPRVSLTKEIVRYIKENDASANILAVIYNPTSEQWRLSLITTEVIFNEGKIIEKHSNPKRFSFVLGKGCKKHTPETMLFTKGVVKDESDLKNRFAIDVVTESFYKELFAWYEWAVAMVSYPEGEGANVKLSNKNNELNTIRLITRLMFVWFIKQKNLVPDWIFDEKQLFDILSSFNPQSKKEGNYYNAVIQNLFFGTLNKAIKERAFAENIPFGRREQYGVNSYYRDDNIKSFFKVSHEKIIEMFKPVPFLNGGLFECLDKLETDPVTGRNVQKYIDGFSRESGRRAFIPNILFFGKEEDGHEGLINLLNRYNFTVQENTPTEIDVALDPELLGKTFENLLGTYNPETSETARKDSGSFYTPREIVNYMVDESLKCYLKEQVKGISDSDLQLLFSDEPILLSDEIVKRVSDALEEIKVLDPACGSGAFPMGCLQRIVTILEKIGNTSDKYSLKLHLIKNCIYGIDIQPIAVQISKLRFFISLVCEQNKNNNSEVNYGIEPLPNLETKFVAANTLIGRKKNDVYGTSSLFENPEIEETKRDLQRIRDLHFSAKTSSDKKKYREKDKELRDKLAKLLVEERYSNPEDARLLVSWNPYDQNEYSKFFDTEWMFGLKEGFDIVIGNPPYIQLQKDGGKLAKLYQAFNYKSFANTGDIYCLFYERGFQLLHDKGILCFITSNKWMRAGYGEKVRDFLANNSNPVQLIDFAGVKVFKSATVDTNVLIFTKEKNKSNTLTCTISELQPTELNKLSDYIHHHFCNCAFNTSDSWVILSPIEQSIKDKIERVGTPLKDWNIKIYRGVLTGYNEAFIITTEKRNEILSNCRTEEERKRTDELIRPILRGRDIKRYSYDWANLWLIYIPWHFPLQYDETIKGSSTKAETEFKKQYPAVFDHMLKYKTQLSERNKAETGIRYEWYALQRWGANYWEEFSKPKIMYGEISQEPQFYLDKQKFLPEATAFIITGEKLDYLSILLNSLPITYFFKTFYAGGGLGENGYRYKKAFLEKLPVPIPNENKCDALKMNVNFQNRINELIYQMYGLSEDEKSFIELQ